MLPLTVDSWKELPDAEVVLLLTKWSLIVNKGSWLETVEGAATETRPGVDGGVTCCCCVELWKFVKKPCVVVGTIADKSRLAAAAATAAETAVLKPAVVVGSGPRRSCNRNFKKCKLHLFTKQLYWSVLLIDNLPCLCLSHPFMTTHIMVSILNVGPEKYSMLHWSQMFDATIVVFPGSFFFVFL